MPLDRTQLLQCLDYATRLNDDGDTTTVCRDAEALAKWVEEQTAKGRQEQLKKFSPVA